MTYRFRNRGEKSDLQRTYEYIAKQKFGDRFHVRIITEKVGIPQNTASAALNFLCSKGMLERLPNKVLPEGRTYPVVMYEYVKNIDKSQHSKPIEHKRVVLKRKLKSPEEKYQRGKIKVQTARINIDALQKLKESLFDCCVQLEIFLAELKEAEYGKVQTSLCPPSEFQIRDGAPQKDRE